MHKKRNELIKKQQDIVNLAKQEERDLTAEELQEFQNLQAEIEKINGFIEMQNQINDNLNSGVIVPYEGTGGIEDTRNTGNPLASKEYEKAWLNATRGIATENDKEVIKKSNATTANGGLFIPTTISSKIFSLITERHPFIADVAPTDVKGNLSTNLFVDIEEGDADVVAEDETPTPEKNKFTNLTVNGYLYGKTIKIPYTMQSMSIEAYTDFITAEIARRVGDKIGRDAIQGNGSSRITGAYYYISNTETVKDTQIITYTDSVDYEDMVNLMAAIATLDGNKVIYVNETTYWKQLALVRDTTGRPLFYSDPATGAITTTFGKLVKIESGIPEGVILAAIPEWYLMNFNRDITVKTADNVTYFRYDVAAHAIVDGAPISGYAFAALVKGV